MKRQRRTFTKEFKTEIAKRIISEPSAKELISKERTISLPLLERWVNDYIATNKKLSIAQVPQRERRSDYHTIQELKAKIADLYMTIEMYKKGSFQQLQKGA